MSYIAGNISNFESRLHQLPANQGDYTSFITEADTYLSSIPAYMMARWNNMFAKSASSILQSNKYYATPALPGSGGGSGGNIQDIGGNADIGGVGGGTISAV